MITESDWRHHAAPQNILGNNLPGHSEETCLSSRHADENVVISANIDAMIVVAANIRLFWKLSLLSFSDENAVFCSKSDVGVDREAVLKLQ